MEKRETFVQAVSKELIGEFLQFIELAVSPSSALGLWVGVRGLFLKSRCPQPKCVASGNP